MYNVEEIKNLGLKDIHLGAEPTNLSTYLWYALAVVVCIIVLVLFLRHIIPTIRELKDLTMAFTRSSSFVTDLNRILKTSCLRYYPQERIASLSGEKWIDFLDHTGMSNFTKFKNDWDGIFYGSHILTKQEKRALYRNAMLWLCSNFWRLP